MSLLGQWMAQILVDTTKVGPALSKSKSEWDGYYTFIQKRDDETTKYISKSLLDMGKAEAKSKEEALSAYKKLTAEEKRLVDTRVKAYNSASYAIERNKKQLNDLRAQVLRFSTIAISVPISFLFKEGLEEYLAFTQQMQNIRAVIGATATEMAMLTNTAMQMSERFAFAPVDVAKAMFDLGQAGLEATDIYKQIGPVMTLAAAGMKDVSFTAELVVTTLKAFQMESEESSRIADVFASSNAKSVSSLDKLSASLKYTAGLWSSMGWDIESLVGTLDTLYDTGVRGEKAGRLLASAINGLQRPTAGASKAIENLLGYTSALDPAFNNIGEIIGKMAEAHATTQDVVKIFGKESAEVINRLIQNYDALDGNVKEVTGNIGESARQAAIQMDSLNGRLNIMKNTFSNVTKSFASVADPALKSMANFATDILKALEKMPAPLKALTLSLMAALAIVLPASAGFYQLSVAIDAFRASLLLAGSSLAAFAAPIAVTIGVITAASTAFMIAKKAQQEWVNAVDSGVSTLAKQGKSVSDLVNELRNLSKSIEDQKRGKEILEQLAAVFPKLREQLNKNAGDTAAAMVVLNKEYAKLARLEAERAKASGLTGGDDLESRIQAQVVEIGRLDAKYQSLIANTRNFTIAQRALEGIGLGDLATDFETLNKNIKSGAINTETLKRIFTQATAVDFIKQMRDVNVSLEDAHKMLNLLKGQRITINNNGLNTSTRLIEQLGIALGDMESKIWTMKFDLQLEGKEATAADVARVVGDTFDEAIKNITLDNKVDMVSLGLMEEDGTFTSYYRNLIAEMDTYVASSMKKNGANWASVMIKSFDSNIKDNTAFDTMAEMLEGLEEYQALKIDIEMGGLKGKDLQDATNRLNFLDKALGSISKTSEEGLTAEEKALRGIVKEALAFGASMSKNFGGAAKEAKVNVDWWQQIINKVDEASKLLQGFGKENDAEYVSSLSKRIQELRDRTGDTTKNVKSMSEKLQAAFAADPELKAIAQTVDFETMLKLVTTQLEGMAIAEAKAFNVPMPVAEYENMAKAATNTRDMLIAQQKTVAEDSFAWHVYQQAIEDATIALLEHQGSYDADKRFQATSAKMTKSTIQEIEDIEALNNAYEDLGNASSDAILNIIENIDPGKGLKSLEDPIKTENMFTAIGALQQLSKVEKEVEERIASTNSAYARGAITTGEYKKEIQTLEAAQKKLPIKKTLTINAVVKGVEDIASGFNSIVKSAIAMDEVFSDLESSTGEKMSAMGASISSVGAALSLLNPAVGGVVSIAGIALDTIGALFDAYNKHTESAYDKAKREFTESLNQAMRDSIATSRNDLMSAFRSFGVSIGQAISGGVKEGTVDSFSDLSSTIGDELFDMLAEQLLVVSGFKESMANVAADLWETLIPGGTEIADLQAKITAAEEAIGGTFTESLGVKDSKTIWGETRTLDQVIELVNESAAISGKTITDLTSARDEFGFMYKDIAYGYLKALSGGNEYTADAIINIAKMRDELAALQEQVSIGAISDEDMAAAQAKIAEYIQLIQDLKDAVISTADESIDFGDALADSLDGALETLQEALAKAVLTGSYSDFKEAVYNQIVSSVTEAIVEAALVKSNIQAIIDQITSGADSTTLDANAILTQIRATWTELTSGESTLSQTLLALRDELAEFGLLDVNVNPGTVVTAIPSSVRDDLIEAIQGTMESLSAAIAEAGLNSSINTVNITTAYITAMTASTVSITQAMLTFTGNNVFQLPTGQTLSTWMEDWMTSYLKKAGV